MTRCRYMAISMVDSVYFGGAIRIRYLRIRAVSAIVDKSIVPVGTADRVREAVHGEMRKRSVQASFDVVSNPEFLKEGAAVEDFMKPDGVMVGTDSDKARAVMHDSYAPFMRTHERLFFMGVDVESMRQGIGSDSRIGYSFIYPGAGGLDGRTSRYKASEEEPLWY